MGNTTPYYLYLKSNYLVSFHHDDYVVKHNTVRMNIYFDNNCLIQSQLPSYLSPNVRINMDTNQENCPSGTCSSKTLRESGCFICSKQNGGDDEKCETCLEDHIIYDGKCVECLSMEVCPFNNSDVVYCIDNNDLSHCVDDNPLECLNHGCISEKCSSGVIGEVECKIGGLGCRGCVCMKGWYPKQAKDCKSICGDGNLTSDEQCEVGGDGCNSCKCMKGWRPVSGSVSCSGICGDGIVVGKEECDSGSGCKADGCQCSEWWYPCSPLNQSCCSFCGDGHVVGSEQCEIGGDGCDDSCRCLEGWHSNFGLSSCKETCGDHRVVGNEQCDSSLGCDNTTCKCSSGWKKTDDNQCLEYCGDGMVVGREECDLSLGCNNNTCVCEQAHPYDKDTGSCTYCGNGIVESDEECDGTSHCNNNCKCEKGYVPTTGVQRYCVLPYSSNSSVSPSSSGSSGSSGSSDSSNSDSDLSSSSEKKKASIADQMHIGKVALIFAVVISFIFL